MFGFLGKKVTLEVPDGKGGSSMFRVGTIVIFVTILAVNSALGAKWYSGGTLHKATLGHWSKASYQNKLATSADFIASNKGRLKIKLRSMEDLKVYASNLVSCIDESGNEPKLKSLKVASVSAACMILLGW